MNTRRTALTLGAAAGGLLATAFLQTAVASADSATNAFADLFGGLGTGTTTDPFGGFLGGLDGFGAPATGTTAATAFGGLFANPTGPETVLTVSGLPPLDQQVEGYQTFDIVGNGGAQAIIGPSDTFNADVSTLTTPIGFTNTEYLVTGSPADTTPYDVTGDATKLPELPTAGSTYDIARFDGFANIYSSVAPEAATKAADLTTIAPGAGGDLVSDTFVTPFGSFDLTPFIGDFNASAGLARDSFDFLSTGDLSQFLTGSDVADGLDSLVQDLAPSFGASSSDIANIITEIGTVF